MRRLGLCAVVLLMAPACSGTIEGSGESSEPGARGGPSGGNMPGGMTSTGGPGPTTGQMGAGTVGQTGAGAAGQAGAGPSDPSKPGMSSQPPPECSVVGRQPIRRLNRIEYNNTVADLLGDTSKPADQFLADSEQYGFDNIAEALTVTTPHVEQFMRSAEKLAATAMTNLGKLLPCDPKAMGEEACARAFVVAFGRRAFRQPLSTEDADRYFALYKSARLASDFASGIRTVVFTILQSPQFLYRLEEPPASGTAPVAPYELASRLSYFFWSSSPDDELLQAAASGKLAQTDEVERQARRLLASPRSRPVVEHFHEKWLKLGQVTQASKPSFAAFNRNAGAMATNMVQETQAFLNDLIFTGDARIETLYKASYSFVNNRLGTGVYGLTQPPAGEAFERVDLDPTRRSGILTQPSILTAQSGGEEGAATTPVLRGVFVRQKFLCQELPTPPPDVPPTKPPLPGATTRETLALHRQPACAGCHQLIDLVGFGLDRYDPIGRYRTAVGTRTVDARGELSGTEDIDGPFEGAIQLAERLARSKEARSCVAKTWFRYAHGRHETDSDQCALNWVQDAFARSGGNIRELLVNLTRSHAFRFKSATAP